MLECLFLIVRKILFFSLLVPFSIKPRQTAFPKSTPTLSLTVTSPLVDYTNLRIQKFTFNGTACEKV